MKDTSTYEYNFKNGNITISRGVETRKYDWFLKVDLNNDEDGNKQFIHLNQTLFLSKKYALEYATELLTKYKLL